MHPPFFLSPLLESINLSIRGTPRRATQAPTGSEKKNVLPCPTTLSTQIRP
jgi:hypothetical protein